MRSPRLASGRGIEMLASTASACAPMRRLPTAIASRSTGRSRSIRRNGGAGAAQSEASAARLLAPLGDGVLRARERACTLVVVEEHALTGRIHGADALTALE